LFFLNLFHFLSGYVILSVIGESNDKILTEIISCGIVVKNVKILNNKLIIELSYSDYEKLCKKKDIEFQVLEVHGFLYLLHILKKRLGFLIGFLVFLVTIVGLSQFIWTIDYDADCNMEQLQKAVELCGLRVGMPKWKLKKPLEMKNIILNNTDDICWCFVYIDGTRATVKVRRSVVPKNTVDIKTPCDIVAMRDGIIKRVIVRKGRTLLQENQVVSAGDTVISGTFDFDEQIGYTVHSIGRVEAYTKHIESGIFKQNYCYKTFTGRKKNFITLNFYKWKIPLYILKRINYEHYETKEKYYDGGFGIGLSIIEITEYKLKKEPISYDTTIEFAKNELEKKITSNIYEPATLLDKQCDVQKISEDTIKVRVTMDFIEEIGTEKEIEEVTIIEPKNNQSIGGN